MNYIHYKTLYLDYLNDREVLLSDGDRQELIQKVSREKCERISTRIITSINEAIRKGLMRNNENQRQSGKLHLNDNNLDENHIKYILSYQAKYNLSTRYLSNHFKLSRTTLTRWKKVFDEKK